MCSLIIGAVAFVLIFVALMNSGGLIDITSVSQSYMCIDVLVLHNVI